MNLERLKLLEQYAREDPNDPFPMYALALEWVNIDPPRAKELLDTLLTDHPDYLPVYYHAGRVYLLMGEPEKAKSILDMGIQKTQSAGETKALAELRMMREEIGNW